MSIIAPASDIARVFIAAIDRRDPWAHRIGSNRVKNKTCRTA
jgi:hypothetical protein